MNRKTQRLKYILSDFFTASLSWTSFYFFRKFYIASNIPGYEQAANSGVRFFISLLVIPFFWLLLHYMSGYYNYPFRKSRLQELGTTFLVTIIGVIIIFFTLLLNDTIYNFTSYYLSLLVLFSLQFFITYIPRVLITSHTNYRIHTGIIGFPTLLIGGNGRALSVYKELTSGKKFSGTKFVGFICLNHQETLPLDQYIPNLGNLDQVNEIINEYSIEEVIIAMEPGDYEFTGQIINKLKGSKVIIKAIPGLYEIFTGRVKMSSVYGTPLIVISHELIPVWQQTIKTFLDILISLFALILTLPLTITLAIIIHFSSPGKVLFVQERIGRFGKPFRMYKFRTMYEDAEESGPALSSENDPRITPIGNFMRKIRLDEIPNFLNVLKGDMSLVGPRPEREYFIDKIIKKAPQYIHLQKVKPGITSWGQVKYGYAGDVDQMIERLDYDLIYIENMSLYVDFKILIYTLLTIIRGRGK